MNTLGIEIAGEDWLVANSQLCADQTDLSDAAAEFRDLHGPARTDSEIINARRRSIVHRMPG